MNFAVFSIIFQILLVSQTPFTSGLRSEKSFLSESNSILNGAKLFLTLESGDTVIRRARDSNGQQPEASATVENAASKTTAGSSEKRSKNSGHGNKKLSKNQDVNSPTGGRNKHHMDKKPLSGGEQQQHHQRMGKRQQIANRQQHGHFKNNKQRQLLKSQQHQEHLGNKRNNGHKSNAENGEHSKDGGKIQPTCRYTKSAWSDCDARTNTQSRTLTLKRGDNNCLATRTIQKKCKKSCRYEKGTWTECKDGQMTRIDKLKAAIPASSTVSTVDSNCEATRSINKKCNSGENSGKSSKSHQNGNAKANKKERKNKDKVNNRGGTQQA